MSETINHYYWSIGVDWLSNEALARLQPAREADLHTLARAATRLPGMTIQRLQPEAIPEAIQQEVRNWSRRWWRRRPGERSAYEHSVRLCYQVRGPYPVEVLRQVFQSFLLEALGVAEWPHGGRWYSEDAFEAQRRAEPSLEESG